MHDDGLHASYPSDDSYDSADPQPQAPDSADAQQQALKSSYDARWDQEQDDPEKESIRLLVLAIARLQQLHCLGIGSIVVGHRFNSMTLEQVEQDRQRCTRPVAEQLAVQLCSMQGLTEVKLYGIGMACCLDSLGALTDLRSLSLHIGMEIPDLVRLKGHAIQSANLSKLCVYAGSGLQFSKSSMRDIQELFPHILLKQLDDCGRELSAVDV